MQPWMGWNNVTGITVITDSQLLNYTVTKHQNYKLSYLKLFRNAVWLPSINPAWDRVTLLIKINTLPLCHNANLLPVSVMVVVKKVCCRLSAHLARCGHWTRRWINHCDARPTITFPATGHHRPLAGTRLYCLVTEAHGCVNNCLELLLDSGLTGNRIHNRLIASPTP